MCFNGPNGGTGRTREEKEMNSIHKHGREYKHVPENPNLVGLPMREDVLEDGVLEQRRLILDNLLLNSPPAIAQRIRVELVKECMRFPTILLPNTLIL